MEYKKQYEKETEKKWWIRPACHGELAFCSNEYMIWLENRIFRWNDVQKELPKIPEGFHVIEVLTYSEKNGVCAGDFFDARVVYNKDIQNYEWILCDPFFEDESVIAWMYYPGKPNFGENK